MGLCNKELINLRDLCISRLSAMSIYNSLQDRSGIGRALTAKISAELFYESVLVWNIRRDFLDMPAITVQ